MKLPKIPDNEPERLKALKSLHILDTPLDGNFERITRLAKQMFDVPIVAITLIDKDRQWFKSSEGLQLLKAAVTFHFVRMPSMRKKSY